MFQITGVKNPASLPINTQFQITGNVTLFGTPYILPLWVVAQIQAPSTGVTVGSLGVGHIFTSSAMAIGGKFTITLPAGFTDTGNYTMKLNLYLGPTEQVDIGDGSYSIPPLPALFSTPSASFSVAAATTGGSNTGGNVTDGVTNLAISNFTTPVQVGGNCIVTVTFDYEGPAASMALSAALGQIPGLGLTFNTMSKTSITITVPAEATPTKQTFTVSVPVLSATSNGGSPYAIEVYLNTQWVHSQSSGGLGTGGVVTVTPAPLTGSGGTEGSLSVTNSPVVQGSTVQFSGSGFSPLVSVTVSVKGSSITPVSIPTNAFGGFVGSFVNNDSPGTYTLVAIDSSNNKEATANFTLVAASSGGGGSGTEGSLSVTNSPVSGGILQFSGGGFSPLVSVTVGVVGGGTMTVPTNVFGGFTGSFTDNDQPGSYVLKATDSSNGKTATANFTLGASSGSGATGTPVLAAPTYANGEVSFKYSGATPNGQVEVSILENGDYLVVTSDSNGRGNGSFSIVGAGTYTLEALDLTSYNNGPNQTFTIGSSGGSGTEGSLSVTNSPVSGGILQFSGGGFSPLVSVTVGVVGGGTMTVPTNVFGGFIGSFTDNDQPGSYVLKATDSSNGKTATANFTLGASSGSGATGTPVLAAPTYANGEVSFKYSGATPNGTVMVTILETGNYNYFTSDASGNGGGTLGIIGIGSYTLDAFDLTTSNSGPDQTFVVSS